MARPLHFIHPSIYVAKAAGRGRGMFAATAIKSKTILERAPVIVMSDSDRKLLDKTLLHDYIFEWGEDRKQCCMALGYVPLYNHASPSNCEYEMDFIKEVITVKTVRAVQAGEELFINYNGDWNNSNNVWFDME